MNKVQKEIDTAMKILSVLSVSGDAVDAVAAVKVHLRDAMKLAAESDTEAADNG